MAPTTRTPTTRSTSIGLLLIAVCLVAANMRPTITAVGPLLGQIGDDTGLTAGALGLLAAVPLLTWAVVSPLVHDLGRRFGVTRVVLWSLVILAAGTVVRSIPGPAVSLWIGTALIGIALAVTNVLMPAVVKRDHPHRLAMVMALYTALLGGLGALASGVAVPLSLVPIDGEPAGWRFALLVTGGVLLPFAIVAWAWAGLGRRDEQARASVRERGGTGIWRDRVAWQVAAYMGLQSAVFYMTVTWLAAISTSTGRSAVVAGIDVMIYQIFALVGALLVPLTLREWTRALRSCGHPVLGDRRRDRPDRRAGRDPGLGPADRPVLRRVARDVADADGDPCANARGRLGAVGHVAVGRLRRGGARSDRVRRTALGYGRLAPLALAAARCACGPGCGRRLRRAGQICARERRNSLTRLELPLDVYLWT